MCFENLHLDPDLFLKMTTLTRFIDISIFFHHYDQNHALIFVFVLEVKPYISFFFTSAGQILVVDFVCFVFFVTQL